MIVTLGNIFDALLGLQEASFADARATLGWRQPMPMWVWVLIAIAAGAYAAWSYRHLIGSRAARTALAAVRTLLILLIVVLLAGPVLVIARERVEPDVLLMLVDRSASMRIRDMPDAGEPISRDAALRRALQDHADLFTADRLGRDREIAWLGFDDAVYNIEPGTPPDADGRGTALRTAIEQALRRAGGRPVAGVVLLTDGRSPQTTGADVLRMLNQQAAPVFVVPFGSPTAALDLSVAQVDAPDRAFVNDIVPVTVHLSRYPDDADVDPSRVKVRLVDPNTGRVLDERSAEGGIDEPIRLTTESTLVGPVTWRVEVSYDDPSRVELITDNNDREIDLELIDRPLRVLYVEGYPRWEYRYLKNMLLREKSIESSVLLLSADREFAQEGELAITRFPNSPEEIKPYDVIIIGDVPADYFTQDQLAMIGEQVSAQGAGLLWIGGAQYTPRTYDATDLAGLLPMRRPATVESQPAGDVGLALRPTAYAQSANILRLRDPDVTGEQDWPDSLPPLRWAQNLGELKPSTEVLATAAGPEGGAVNLITRMNYGTGRIIYVATDETWRWRYGRGELFFEQAWTQLVRTLGRSRVQQDNQRVRMNLSNRRVGVDQAVVVTLRIDDPLLLKRQLPRIAVAVTRAGDAAATPLETIELRAKPSTSGDVRDYETIWRPSHSGALVLRVVEPALVDLGVTQTMDVVRPDDEMRHAAPDHDRLAHLARQTSGAVIEPANLDLLAKLAPNRAQRTPDDLREPLWDSWLSLIVFLTLLTAEWICRKFIRLA